MANTKTVRGWIINKAGRPPSWDTVEEDMMTGLVAVSPDYGETLVTYQHHHAKLTSADESVDPGFWLDDAGNSGHRVSVLEDWPATTVAAQAGDSYTQLAQILYTAVAGSYHYDIHGAYSDGSWKRLNLNAYPTMTQRYNGTASGYITLCTGDAGAVDGAVTWVEHIRCSDEAGTKITRINPGVGADVDTVIRGTTDAALFVTNAGTDNIGIGILAPDVKVHVYEADAALNGMAANGLSLLVQNDSAGDAGIGFEVGNGTARFALFIDNSTAGDPLTICDITANVVLWTWDGSIVYHNPANNDIDFQIEDSTGVGGGVLSTFDSALGVQYFPDNKKASFGNSAAVPDLVIYSNGTDGLITGAASVYIDCPGPVYLGHIGNSVQATGAFYAYMGIAVRNGMSVIVNTAAGANCVSLSAGGDVATVLGDSRDLYLASSKLGTPTVIVTSGNRFQLGVAYAAGDPATTGYLVVYDNTGTGYKIPALAV